MSRPFRRPQVTQPGDHGADDVAAVAEDDIRGHQVLTEPQVLARPGIRVGERVGGVGQRLHRRSGFGRSQAGWRLVNVDGELAQQRGRPLEPGFIELSRCDVALLCGADASNRLAHARKTRRGLCLSRDAGVAALFDGPQKRGCRHPTGDQKRHERETSSSCLHPARQDNTGRAGRENQKRTTATRCNRDNQGFGSLGRSRNSRFVRCSVVSTRSLSRLRTLLRVSASS